MGALFKSGHLWVYRRPVPNSPLKEYKVLGTYSDLPSRYLVRAYTDYEFRKTWDSNIVGWKAPSRRNVSTLRPSPYGHKVHETMWGDRGAWQECAGCVCVCDIVVCVDDFRQDVVIQPTKDGQGCNVWFGYYDDPKASVHVGRLGGVCVCGAF